jgi:hypothetical protein
MSKPVKSFLRKSLRIFCVTIKTRLKKDMSEIITRIDLYALKNESHVQAGESMSAVFVKHSPQALGVKPLYDLYKGSLNKEQEAFDLMGRNDLAARMASQDHVRCSLLHGFIDSVRVAKKHFDSLHREAAYLLHSVLKRYEDVEKLPFDSDATAAGSLVFALHQASVEQAIAQLDMGGWRDRIVQESAALTVLTTERYSEAAEKIALKMRVARTATDKYYNALVNQMENLWMVGITSSIVFIRELNAVIEKIAHIVLATQEASEQKKAK